MGHRAELRHRRSGVTRYCRSTGRVVYLRTRSKERRGLHGSSELAEVHDNQETESKIIQMIKDSRTLQVHDQTDYR